MLKAVLMLGLCVGSVGSVVGQTVVTPVAPPPSASAVPPATQAVVAARLAEATPALTTQADVTRYLNAPALLNFSTAQVASFNGRDADIIFIGDSITQGWLSAGKTVWDANYASRNALDFGISGDGTQHVLWRLSNYPLGRLHPRVGVVLIGTNNMRNTADEIADGVKAVIAKTQSLFPGIRIILVSIMPNRRANDLMMSANKLLKAFADNDKVYYLDLVPLMTPVGDNWKGLSADHLHPDAAGYQLWADALNPLLNRLMGAK